MSEHIVTAEEQNIDRTPLIPFRERLDSVDARILEQFARRYRVREEMTPYKMALEIPVVSERRMHTVLEQTQGWAKERRIPVEFAKDLYILVLEHSHKFEEEYRKQITEADLPQEVEGADMIRFREQIDLIDAAVIDYFAERYQIRDDTMPIKVKHGMPIEVRSRVDEVVERVAEFAETLNIPTDFARDLYTLVINYSHRYEEEFRQGLSDDGLNKED